MNRSRESIAPLETLADVVGRLGSVPLERIPARPAPGIATEADILARPGGEKRLFELVEGVLVEKPMGYYESVLAGILVQLLRSYLDQHDLGILLLPDGPLRLAPGLVRLPDVSFVSWDRFPGRELPDEAILDTAPDLAVEILSPGNTAAEMERKLQEYLAAGTRMVWYVDPSTRTAKVFTTSEAGAHLGEEAALDGGEVLPGFRLPLRDWFARAGRRAQG